MGTRTIKDSYADVISCFGYAATENEIDTAEGEKIYYIYT